MRAIVFAMIICLAVAVMAGLSSVSIVWGIRFADAFPATMAPSHGETGTVVASSSPSGWWLFGAILAAIVSLAVGFVWGVMSAMAVIRGLPAGKTSAPPSQTPAQVAQPAPDAVTNRHGDGGAA